LEHKYSKYKKHNKELEVLYEAFVKKKSKLFFSTNRKIVLFSNGCFGQYRVNTKTNELKQFLEPTEMARVERQGNSLTIQLRVERVDKVNSFTYKFSNQKQTVTWLQSLRAFVNTD
jgi:hypothetical protein